MEDLDARLGLIHFGPWAGTVFRMHSSRYAATEAAGSLLYSGRYNRGLDHFEHVRVFAALYVALNAETALAEVIRGVDPEALDRLDSRSLSSIECGLAAVFDLRAPEKLGLDLESLLDDYDYSVPQSLAAAAFSHGAEGILVPSATALGDNLVIFPANLRPGSTLTVVSSRSPRLRRLDH